MMDQLEKLLSKIIEMLSAIMDRGNGMTANGDIIIYQSAADATFKGKYVQINVLVDCVFNNLYIDENDVSAKKGYQNTIPAGTILTPGRGKYFTSGSIDQGGMIQLL